MVDRKTRVFLELPNGLLVTLKISIIAQRKVSPSGATEKGDKTLVHILKGVYHKMAKEKINRTRNYACVVYPESAPENWKKIIGESKVPVLISPLHDKDKNATGEDKKAHYHIMVMYEGPKTVEQASEFFNSFGGVGCEVVKSARAYARYLCHLDNPDKAQYDIGDVIAFGGADYISLIGTAADKTKSIREMIEYIELNDVTCFSDLCLYTSQERSDWFDTLINSGAYFIKEYIKSRTWKMHHFEEK